MRTHHVSKLEFKNLAHRVSRKPVHENNIMRVFEPGEVPIKKRLDIFPRQIFPLGSDDDSEGSSDDDTQSSSDDEEEVENLLVGGEDGSGLLSDKK